MGYWKGDKTNWEIDRRARRKTFDLLKERLRFDSLKSQKPSNDSSVIEKHSWNRKRTSPIFAVLLLLFKVALILFIFYAAAMFLSHGKHWP